MREVAAGGETEVERMCCGVEREGSESGRLRGDLSTLMECILDGLSNSVACGYPIKSSIASFTVRGLYFL